MPIVIDTHVHIYPDFDLGPFLVAVTARLRALAPGAVPAVCLTERSGQHIFRDLAVADKVPGTDVPIERLEGEGGVALCVRDGTGPFYILPGRQVATAERLELLVLGRDLELADGMPAADLIPPILAAGGIPVLTWAFGKWWLGRSRKVRALITQFVPERLWLGDTTMRPREWPHGTIMRWATALGARVLAGSDPLPRPDEVRFAGCYASLLDGEIDSVDPAGSILGGLRAIPAGGRTVGTRSTLWLVLRRLARHRG